MLLYDHNIVVEDDILLANHLEAYENWKAYSRKSEDDNDNDNENDNDDDDYVANVEVTDAMMQNWSGRRQLN
jgi:hypothetical protein